MKNNNILYEPRNDYGYVDSFLSIIVHNNIHENETIRK